MSSLCCARYSQCMWWRTKPNLCSASPYLTLRLRWPRSSCSESPGPRPCRRPVSRILFLDDHSSRRRVTAALQQPTRGFRLPACAESLRLGASGRYARARWRVRARSLPIWSCSVWGLPCGIHYWLPGALLPHLFTLTLGRLRDPRRYVLCCTGRLCALKRKSRTLSGTLPCGVRTFLPRSTLAPERQRSSSRLHSKSTASKGATPG